MPEDTLRILREIPEGPYFRELLIALVALIAALFLWRALRKRLKGIRVFDNASGQVEVSRGALTDLVENACRSIGAGNSPTVKIWTKRGKINVTVRLKLEAGQKLTEISSRIQEHLTQTLQSTLGVERIGNIDVRVTSFKHSHQSSSQHHTSLSPFPKDTTIREVEQTGDVGNRQPWFTNKDEPKVDEDKPTQDPEAAEDKDDEDKKKQP